MLELIRSFFPAPQVNEDAIRASYKDSEYFRVDLPGPAGMLVAHWKVATNLLTADEKKLFILGQILVAHRIISKKTSKFWVKFYIIRGHGTYSYSFSPTNQRRVKERPYDYMLYGKEYDDERYFENTMSSGIGGSARNAYNICANCLTKSKHKEKERLLGELAKINSHSLK